MGRRAAAIRRWLRAARQSCESFPFDAEIGFQLQPDFAVDESAFVDQHARIAFSGHYRLGNVGKEVGTPVFDGRIDFVQQQVGGGVFAGMATRASCISKLSYAAVPQISDGTKFSTAAVRWAAATARYW